MADLIDREELLKEMEALYCHHLEMRNFSADGAVNDCIELVQAAPSCEVKAEEKKGSRKEINMKCFMCEQTDGLVYSSNPVKLKCTVTGKLHNVTDSCDCCCDRDYSRMNYDLFRSMSLLALTLAGTNKHKPDCIFFVDEPDMGAHIYDCMMREDFETNITGVKGFSCELCKNYTTAGQVKKMLKDKDAAESNSKDQNCGKELSKFFSNLWANPSSNKVEEIKKFIADHCDTCEQRHTRQCELYSGGIYGYKDPHTAE